MKISVVIPTLDRPTLQKCIDSLSDADEIIVERNFTQCCVENFNDGYKKTTGDFILHTGDRAFYEPNWRAEIERALKRINYSGVVSFFANVVASGVVSRDYIETVQKGYLLWPEYCHYYCDMEQGEVARKRLKYTEALNLIHIAMEKEPYTHQPNDKLDAQEIWDRKVYYQREAMGFPQAFISDMEKRNKLCKFM